MTGRPARSDTFTGLKQKRELSQIFEQVSATYRNKLKALTKEQAKDGQQQQVQGGRVTIDLQRVTLQFILQCLENRQ